MINLKRHPSKVWSELVVDEKERTVASFHTSYRSEAEVEELISLFLAAPEMRSALSAIALKDPRKVGAAEAADLAVEFHAMATGVLRKMNALKAEDAHDVVGA